MLRLDKLGMANTQGAFSTKSGNIPHGFHSTPTSVLQLSLSATDAVRAYSCVAVIFEPKPSCV